MTKDYSHYVRWVHMLAWRTLDFDLNQQERKAIGAFIGSIKKGKYISGTNSLFLRVVEVIDEHSPVKSSTMPKPKAKYNAAEKKQIREGIRELHKTAKSESAVGQFCYRFLFSATGKRRTKTHSENRYWHAAMTLDSQA